MLKALVNLRRRRIWLCDNVKCEILMRNYQRQEFRLPFPTSGLASQEKVLLKVEDIKNAGKAFLRLLRAGLNPFSQFL